MSLFTSQSSLPPRKSVSSAPDFDSLGGGRSAGSEDIALRLFPLVNEAKVTGVFGKIRGDVVFLFSGVDGAMDVMSGAVVAGCRYIVVGGVCGDWCCANVAATGAVGNWC